MADLPLTFADPDLTARLTASLDVEGKIPRALEALGPIGGRDVLLVDGEGGLRAGQLAGLGARVTVVSGTAPEALAAVPNASVDAIVACWTTFRADDADWLAVADRVLRPEGRLLVVHDYGRDDVSRLLGDRPEYGDWSRRDGWFQRNGFRIRVIHGFWTFDTLEDAQVFLGAAFGPTGEAVAGALRRPRLSYNLAIYHRSRGAAGASAA